MTEQQFEPTKAKHNTVCELAWAVLHTEQDPSYDAIMAGLAKRVKALKTMNYTDLFEAVVSQDTVEDDSPLDDTSAEVLVADAKYSTLCCITGEPMHEGYLLGDANPIKYEADLVKELRKAGYEGTDEEILDDAFEEDYMWTTFYPDNTSEDVIAYEIDGNLFVKK